MLLYAIQDSVLNSEPGEVTTTDTPNIKANNITLIAVNGGIGIDGDSVSIAYNALDQLDNLKLLANAKAGDLTWGEDEVTLRQQQGITVQVLDVDGEVNVEGRDNVYLLGVNNTTLNISDIATMGNIRLQGDSGVYASGSGTIKGVDLIIAGGTGGIGTADKMINTDLSGSIDANAKDSIYLSAVNGEDGNNDLKILALATDADAILEASGNIIMVNTANVDEASQGRIRAGGVLELTAGGSIGT